MVGEVIDQRGAPVADAAIDVEDTFWRTVSRRDGSFTLSLPPGRWTVRVRRIGFTPAAAVAVADSVARDTMRFVLLDARSELRGIVVRDQGVQPFVATMTAETVRQAPPLGEADILRLLPMLPAVSQPNDVIGRLHLAGGASDEHAVTLDGYPLQSPYHVHSVLGAFNVSALDKADVLVHHLPSALDGRLSGVINLETKRPSPTPTREVVVSLLSSSATISQPALPGGIDLLASGRVTYLDQLLRAYARSSGDRGDDLTLPSYRDAIIKIGRVWDDGFSIEALGYGTLDYWARTRTDDDAPGLRYGEHLFGTRAAYRSARWDVVLRASADAAFAASQRRYDLPNDTIPRALIDSIDLRQRWATAALEVRRHDRRWEARGGVKADLRRHDQRWSGTLARDLFRSALPATYDARSRLTLLSLFGEGALGGTSWWNATAGAHASFVDGRSYVAPRLLVGARLSATARLQLAVDRRHQFDAIAGEPDEGSITQPVFLLRTPRVADMVAAAATWRPSPTAAGRRMSAELTVYARRYHDRLVAGGVDGGPASVARDYAPPGFRRVPGSTVGASLTADLAMENGIVAQGAYTLQRARESADGQSRPTAWDAPHQLSVFAGVPLGGRWTLSTTAQAHSGSAVTPVAARLFVPLGGGRYGDRFLYGEPNSGRLPSYMRVDIGLRRHWSGWGARWALSLQALNVLSRTNVLEYDWRNYFACMAISECSGTLDGRRGLPILPSAGLEVAW